MGPVIGGVLAGHSKARDNGSWKQETQDWEWEGCIVGEARGSRDRGDYQNRHNLWASG